MVAIPPDEFRSLARGLSRERFRDFVAALWTARGWKTRREAGLVVARNPATGEEAVLLPVPARPGDRWLGRPARQDDAVSTVVTAGGRAPSWARERPDVTVVGVDELRRMALYGVAVDERAALFRDFFDRTPTRPERPPLATALVGAVRARVPAVVRERFPGAVRERFPGAVRERLPDAVEERLDEDAWWSSRRPVLVAGTVLVALVVVLALVSGSGVLSGPPVEGSGTPGADPDTATATPASPEPTPVEPVVARRYPPGVDETGVTDVDALLVAHVQNVSFQPYSVTFTYREVASGHTARAREVVHRVSKTRYVTNVTRSGSFRTGPWVVSAIEAYANGKTRYERHRTPNGTRYAAQQVYSGRVGLVEQRSAVVLEALLRDAANTSATRLYESGGRTFYRIRVGDDGDPSTVDDAALLLVDGRGIVHTLRWTYRKPGMGGLEVTVAVELSAFGDTRIVDPPWLSAAQNATGG